MIKLKKKDHAPSHKFIQNKIKKNHIVVIK